MNQGSNSPITLILTCFLNSEPTPLETMHWYKPSWSLETSLISRVPFGWSWVWSELDKNPNSVSRPKKEYF